MVFWASQLSDCFNFVDSSLHEFAKDIVDRLEQNINRAVLCCESRVQVSFDRASPFEDSIFTVTKGDKILDLKVADLFPSGRFVEENISHPSYVKALTDIASKIDDLGALEEKLTSKSLTDNNFAKDVADSVMANLNEESILRIVCDLVPLNENEVLFQEVIRDRVTADLKEKDQEWVSEQ